MERFLEPVVSEKELAKMRDEIDTGDVWACPICGKTYRLIHTETTQEGKGRITHRLKHLKHNL